MAGSFWVFFCAAVVRASASDSVERVYVTEDSSVTLRNNQTGIKSGFLILWSFGATDIAFLYGQECHTHFDEQFQDRLHIDTQTGSLTISNIRPTHSGIYKLLVRSDKISISYFNVTVYAPLSIPKVKHSSEISECQPPLTNTPQPSGDQSRQSPNSSISTDRESTPGLCTVLCTVSNGPGVSLSWTRGKETLKQISYPDLSAPLCLFLEMHTQTKTSYFCVAANPASHQSTQLNVQEVCPQAGRSSVHCCGSVELVVRLVLSALVGLATVIILLYHFTSGTDSDGKLRKKRVDTSKLMFEPNF